MICVPLSAICRRNQREPYCLISPKSIPETKRPKIKEPTRYPRVSPNRGFRMSNTTLVEATNPVKRFELALYVIECHHKGYPDELVYIPTCCGCSKPITDPGQANLVTERWDHDEPLKPAGRVDGLRLLRHPGTVRVYHLACDPGGYPWRRLSTVQRKDQRWVGGL